MAAREVTVTDNLLKTMIGIKYESGVDPDKIQKILDFFDSSSEKEKPNWRESFLAELTALTPSEGAPKARSLLASDIWPSRILDGGSSQEFAAYAPTAHTALIEGVGADNSATALDAREDNSAEDRNSAPEREWGAGDAVASADVGSAADPVEETPPSAGDVSANADPAPATSSESEKRGTIMWGKLTPLDIERAVGEVARRRQETLARHARELEELDADESQVAALKQAIEAFAQKFKSPANYDEMGNNESEEANLKLVS
jgi:hypothetical protein